MNLSITQINYLNIGLMIVSCAIAFVYPFELFLIAYAVLGPLHYLTEISWLHDRKYFAETSHKQRAKRARQYWLVLIAVTMMVMVYGLIAEKVLGQGFSPRWEIALFYLVFAAAALLTFDKRQQVKVTVMLVVLLSLMFFSSSRYYALIAFLLATIIHVFVFTGAFMLLGALRGKSLSGVVSLIVFILCAASVFVYAPDASAHTVGEYVRNSHASFRQLNKELLRVFQLGSGAALRDIYDSTAGLTVMRLIAFSYTYHYLNWFSKTSIIKWHEVTRSRTALVVSLWLMALALYAYSYEAGIIALYFLSMLHVMLEFPLNHQTFVGIGKELRRVAKMKRASIPRLSASRRF